MERSNNTRSINLFIAAILIMSVFSLAAFSTNAIALKGDVDGDDDIDLKDLVISLQTAAGMAENVTDISADVNEDGKLGIEESVYILKVIPDQVYPTIIDNRDTHTVGLRYYDQKNAYDGYLLYPAKHDGSTFLLDNYGRVIRHWFSYDNSKNKPNEPGQSTYFLKENADAGIDPGTMVRAGIYNCISSGGGEGGRLEFFKWDTGDGTHFGTTTTDAYLSLVFCFTNSYGYQSTSHHDFAVLDNGNIMLLAVESIPKADVEAAGGTTNLDIVNPEWVFEIKPDYDAGPGEDPYEIVWEWHIWDHTIQNNNSGLSNYGDPEDHPEKLYMDTVQPAFWNHGNSIDYNEDTNQVMLSLRKHDNIVVFEHTASYILAEKGLLDESKSDDPSHGNAIAASGVSGVYGKGGDFLWRYGDPDNYSRGVTSNDGDDDPDKYLEQQHDAQWIKSGYPHAGDITVFNNNISFALYTTVLRINVSSEYTGDGIGYFRDLPAGEIWEENAPQAIIKDIYYSNEDPSQSTTFYSEEISGAHMLPNGNFMVTAGIQGRFFEVTEGGMIVWEYYNPIGDTVHWEAPYPADGVYCYNVDRDPNGVEMQYDARGHISTAIFRTTKYPKDHWAFDGRDMDPIADSLEAYGDCGPLDGPPHLP